MLVIGLPVKGAITMKKKHIISEETLTHTVPCRQKQAKEYLQGRSPGVMRSYAPDAHADDKDGFVESDDTVHRLAGRRDLLIHVLMPRPRSCLNGCNP